MTVSPFLNFTRPPIHRTPARLPGAVEGSWRPSGRGCPRVEEAGRGSTASPAFPGARLERSATMADVAAPPAAAAPPRSAVGRPARTGPGVVLVALVLAALVACAPPGRVHTGPIPVRMISPDMGRDLPVYRGIDDA